MKYILRWLIRALFNLIARVEVTGYEYLPKDGSYVIATNHLGIVDAPMAFYALDNWDMFVMVAEKWEKITLFRWLGKYFNLIFIDRYNPDIKTMRKVIMLMEEDNILVIAPEGTRHQVVADLQRQLAGDDEIGVEQPVQGFDVSENHEILGNSRHFPTCMMWSVPCCTGFVLS